MANLIWHPRNGDLICEIYAVIPAIGGYHLLVDGYEERGGMGGTAPILFSAQRLAQEAAQRLEDEACEDARSWSAP